MITIDNFRMKHHPGPAELAVSGYQSDLLCPALVVSEPGTGIPLLTATVFIVGIRPRPGNLLLKTWSENEGIYGSLLEHGLVSDAVAHTYPTGFGTALEVEAADELLHDVENYLLSVRSGEIRNFG